MTGSFALLLKEMVGDLESGKVLGGSELNVHPGFPFPSDVRSFGGLRIVAASFRRVYFLRYLNPCSFCLSAVCASSSSRLSPWDEVSWRLFLVGKLIWVCLSVVMPLLMTEMGLVLLYLGEGLGEGLGWVDSGPLYSGDDILSDRSCSMGVWNSSCESWVCSRAARMHSSSLLSVR